MAVTKLGLDPIEVWNYTPYEIGLICENIVDKNKRQIDELLFLSWHIEAFARQKRLPRLERVINDFHKPKNSTLADEVLKAMAREKGVEI